MATNENVNKVIYGNQTVMDITDTTAEESDVASGEVFYKADGSRSVGTLNADSAVWGSITGTLSDQTDLQIELNRAYTKTASETSSIDDLDLIPVQKIFASSDGRRNIKFINLKSVLKTYFDDFYSTFSGSFNDLTDKPTVDQTYSATSDNAQSGKAVASAISGKADISLLKSTVGWVGKNFFNENIAEIGIAWNGSANSARARMMLPIESSKTFTLTLNGSNNLDYIGIAVLNDNIPLSPTEITAFPREIVTTASTKYILFAFSKTSITLEDILALKLMLRDASITDDTYEPYHESVEEEIEQIYADNGVLGAKNLLHGNATSQTINGVTFTVNDDGSITADGTATANIFFHLCPSGNRIVLPTGNYICSGSTGGASDKSTYYIYMNDVSTSTEVVYVANNEATVSLNEGKEYSYSICIKNGVTLSNQTFYPMLRLASDPDDTYAPYAMTNRELTEELTAINSGLDDWTATAQVQSDGTVTFTGLNDSYAYSRPYYELPSGESAYTCSKVSKSGSETSVTLTYTTDAPSGTVCKLRILK